MTQAPLLRHLSRGEWLALVAAVLVAHAFYARIVLYPSEFDARNYLDVAQDIARNGLFSKYFYSNIRTYGYPLVLAGLQELAAAMRVPWQLVIFETQLATYLLATAVVRNSVARTDERLARWVFVGLVLNVFALSYTPESLTESLSVSLLLFVAGCWMRMHATGALALPVVLLGTLLGSFSVMIRPANLFVLAAWALGVVLLALAQHVRPRRVLAVMGTLAIGTALPMAPQYSNNARFWDTPTPLVVAQLSRNQQVWGIQNIKYATALPPVPTPSIFYVNPYAEGGVIDPERPLAWYFEHPIAGLRTLGLHVFNMLDQDLLFTYSRDLDPWYRVPLAIFNHALVGLALVGAALLPARTQRIVVILLAALVGAHLAVHATTAVEMRFGLPLLVLAGPLAAWAWLQCRERPVRAPLVATVFVVAWVGTALVLSSWVREQAPSIRAWHAQPAQGPS